MTAGSRRPSAPTRKATSRPALLGFLGRDHTGLAGIEADLDDALGGKPGALYFERDGGGKPIAFGAASVEPGKPGADVRLTIDRYIQRLIENELDSRSRTTGQRRHDHRHGPEDRRHPGDGQPAQLQALRALTLDDRASDLYRNRAVTDLYEPGSVMKTLTMATAIDLGLVTPNTTYFDTGTVDQGRLRRSRTGTSAPTASRP